MQSSGNPVELDNIFQDWTKQEETAREKLLEQFASRTV